MIFFLSLINLLTTFAKLRLKVVASKLNMSSCYVESWFRLIPYVKRSNQMLPNLVVNVLTPFVLREVLTALRASSKLSSSSGTPFSLTNIPVYTIYN